MVQPDGRIVAGGFSSRRFALVRYTAAGSKDTSFASGGIKITKVGGQPSIGFDLALQPDGMIVLAGHVKDPDGGGDAGVARYGTTGQLDETFGAGGTQILDWKSSYRAVQSLALGPGGTIVVAGTSDGTQYGRTTEDIAVGRFTTTGAPDGTFGAGGSVFTDFSSSTVGRDEIAEAVATQPDGKVLAAGYTFGGTGSSFNYSLYLCRYLTGGARDATFGAFNGCTLMNGSDANDLALQTDGKILVATRNFGVVRILGG